MLATTALFCFFIGLYSHVHYVEDCGVFSASCIALQPRQNSLLYAVLFAHNLFLVTITGVKAESFPSNG